MERGYLPIADAPGDRAFDEPSERRRDAALRSAGGGTGGPPAAGSLDERVALLLSVGEEWSVPRRHSGLHLGSRLDAAADAHQRR